MRVHLWRHLLLKSQICWAGLMGSLSNSCGAGGSNTRRWQSPDFHKFLVGTKDKPGLLSHLNLPFKKNLGFLEAKVACKPQNWPALHENAAAAIQGCNWPWAVGWVFSEHIDGTIPTSAHINNSTKTY